LIPTSQVADCSRGIERKRQPMKYHITQNVCVAYQQHRGERYNTFGITDEKTTGDQPKLNHLMTKNKNVECVKNVRIKKYKNSIVNLYFMITSALAHIVPILGT